MATALTDATAIPSAYTQPDASTFAPFQTEIARTTAAVQTFVQETQINAAEISQQNRRLTAELASITTQNDTAEQNHRADMAELQSLVDGVRTAIAENQATLQREIIILKKPIPPEEPDIVTKFLLRNNRPELNRLMSDYYTNLGKYNKELELYNKSLLKTEIL
jgi:biotin carboxylase